MTRFYPTAISVVAALLVCGSASAQTTERPEVPAAKERAPGQQPGGNAQGNQDREPGKQDRGPDTKGRADTPEKGQKQSEPKGKRDTQKSETAPTTTPKGDRAKDAARQSDSKGDEPTKKQAQPKTKTDGQSGAEPGTKRADPKGTEPGTKRADPKGTEPGTKRADPKGTESDTKRADPKGSDPAAKSAQQKGATGDGQRIQVTEEQRTRVRDAFPREQLNRSTRVNISVSVGVSVPRSVELYAIPTSIVSIAPAYRGYRYFVVEDRICIVDPATYVVVDVIEVRAGGGSTQTAGLELSDSERAILLRHVDWDHAKAEISVDLALGADIPDRVRIHEFPRAIRAEIPKLANYHYVVTGRDVVIVEPRSRDIVLVVRQ